MQVFKTAKIKWRLIWHDEVPEQKSSVDFSFVMNAVSDKFISAAIFW